MGQQALEKPLRQRWGGSWREDEPRATIEQEWAEHCALQEIACEVQAAKDG
jgi:hypothetical protein